MHSQKYFQKPFEDIVDNAPLDFSLDLYFCINALKKGNVIEFPVYFKKEFLVKQKVVVEVYLKGLK